MWVRGILEASQCVPVTAHTCLPACPNSLPACPSLRVLTPVSSVLLLRPHPCRNVECQQCINQLAVIPFPSNNTPRSGLKEWDLNSQNLAQSCLEPLRFEDHFDDANYHWCGHTTSTRLFWKCTAMEWEWELGGECRFWDGRGFAVLPLTGMRAAPTVFVVEMKICCFQLKEEAEMPIDQKEAEVPSLREEVALEGELLQVPALPNTYLYFIRMTMLRLMSWSHP